MELEEKYLIQKAIFRQTQLKPLTRLVALCILDHRNDKKGGKRYGQCNPGQKRIADILGVSKKSVCLAVAELEANGVITTRRTGSSSEFVFMPICSLNTLLESTVTSDGNQRLLRGGRKTRARIAAEPVQTRSTDAVSDAPTAQVEPQRELTQAELSLGRYTAVALARWGEKTGE